MKGKIFSLVSLICGIAGIPIAFLSVDIFQWSSIIVILTILGIVFSLYAKKKEGKNRLNKAGFIVSIIVLLVFVACVVIFGVLLLLYMKI